MNKISIKYKKGTSPAAILALEKKYGLKQESHIPALRIYGYNNDANLILTIINEDIVEYVEKQESMGIAD